MNPGQIFLSYGRKDDEPWVERLRDYLVAKKLPVWWDRRCMESRGRTFFQELRDAIHDSERVLLVVGPAALQSEYVRLEWQHALLYSRAVLPLLRIGEYGEIPPDYALFHSVDCRAERDERGVFEEILARLETPVPALAELRGVPPLPPSFIPRADFFDALTATVMADLETATIIEPKRQITFLRGMPGTGKSVLAVAFARARATRMAFASGVVFVAAGKSSSVDAILRRALNALGVAAQAADDETRLTALLQQQLSRDRVLLILDDVWQMNRIEPFRQALGLRTRILVTTRDSALAAGLQAAEIEVDVLDPAKSMELLAQVSGVTESQLPAEAIEIVTETGRLPLSLAIVGAMLRQFPDRWTSYRDRLRHARIDRIEASIPGYPDANLARVIAVSLEDLPAETQSRFVDLAVLHDPPRIPRAVLEAWWASEGMDPIDAEDTVDTLAGRSLIRRDAAGIVTLHDLCIDYARHFQPSLQQAHGRVIAFYDRMAPAGWAAHPDDGYLFDNLGHHLEGAGRAGDLLHLVLDSPEWLLAKSRAARPQSDGLDDIDRALRIDAPLETKAALHMAAQVWRTDAALWAPGDLETLVLLGRGDEALQAAARRSQDPFTGYLRLAQVFANRDTAVARPLLEAAERSARLDPSPWKRAAALAQVSRAWRSIGDAARADAVLGEATRLALTPIETRENPNSIWPLVSLVGDLVEARCDTDARAIAEVQADEFGTLWSALAAGLARRGEVDLVDRLVAERLAAQPVAMRAAHMGRIADAAPQGDARKHWLAEGLAFWHRLEDIDERFQCAQLLLPPAHQDGAPAADELREVLRTYPASKGAWSDISGEHAVQGLALFGDIEGAREIAKRLNSVSNRAAAQLRLVQALVHTGSIDEAVDAAQQIETIADRAGALSLTALELARRADPRAEAMLDTVSALYAEGRARTHLFDAALLCAQALLLTDRDTGHRLLRWIAERIDILPPDFDFSMSLADFSRTCFAQGLAPEGAAAQSKVTNDVVYQDLVENIALDQARAGNLQRATAILALLDSGWRKEAAAAEIWILCEQWDKAAAAIDAITRDYNRIVKRAHLAAAIRPLDPARSDALFTQAEQDAAVLEDDWMVDELRQEALGEIVGARLSCSNTGAAWDTVASMNPSRVKVQAALRYVEAIWESQQNEAAPILQALLELPGQAGNDETGLLEDLSRTLIRCGLASDAVRCIERLSAIDRSAEHRAAISRLYASMGDFERASRQILAESVDLYAGTVAKWAPDYEKIEPGLSRRVLAEITRVAAWFRDDWRQIHDIITASVC